MSKLALHLPPFAPDYSGVCSALFELGGLTVINDASGCTGNYTGYDEPRWYGSDSLVFCSNLRELDVVMGDDQRLIDKILRAAEDTNPRFIAVLGSPVPMLIGTDLAGIAAEVEAASAIPSFGFDSTGLAYYDKGVSAALLDFAKAFVIDKPGQVADRVNLLGATPLDFGVSDNLELLAKLLQTEGLELGACFAMGSSFDELSNAASASVNLVLTSSGLDLAKYLKQRFGTPYVVGIPMGKGEARRLIAELKSNLTDCSSHGIGKAEYTTPASIHASQHNNKRVLIIHEQIIANSLRNCLKADFGLQNIDVVTPFTLTRALTLADANDRQIDDERKLTQVINDGYDILIADPLFAQLLKPRTDSSVQFIPLPHLAVSSKLHWHDSVNFIGDEILLHLCPYLQE